ncbi:MAG: HU family DNA-binding protein [Pseudomonadota bacterium]
MTKKEFLEHIALVADRPISEVRHMMDATLSVLDGVLEKGNSIGLAPFGQIKTVTREAGGEVKQIHRVIRRQNKVVSGEQKPLADASELG